MKAHLSKTVVFERVAQGDSLALQTGENASQNSFLFSRLSKACRTGEI